MTPTVRGAQKVKVAATLLVAAVVTGGLGGFVVGVAWAVLPLAPLSAAGLTALLAAAVVADLAHRVTGRPRPLAVGRQVPREWARLFSPVTVAVLFGARLGVGPATILPTWLWWAATIAAAALGVWISVAAGAVFAGVRILVQLLVAEWVRHDVVTRMARLRAVGARLP